MTTRPGRGAVISPRRDERRERLLPGDPHGRLLRRLPRRERADAHAVAYPARSFALDDVGGVAARGQPPLEEVGLAARPVRRDLDRVPGLGRCGPVAALGPYRLLRPRGGLRPARRGRRRRPGGGGGGAPRGAAGPAATSGAR